MLTLAEYQLTVKVREDEEFVLWRGRGIDGGGVLLRVPASDRPSSASLRRLVVEFGLKEAIEADWAARPMALVNAKGKTALVLTDPGGIPLDELVGRAMPIARFLPLAIGLADAVAAMHGRGLVHKDLKPSHILVDPEKKTVRLTGFGIASQLPREHQAPEPLETIAGTLAYMAPEQTGRMNRSIDTRSDLYAVGVILYELLTGRLPFTGGDAMEWVHSHIARKPVPPATRTAGIAEPLSDIVIKLLAKTAEDRYQTASGLAEDLRRCHKSWDTTARIEPFPLGSRDATGRLMIPERLFGRDRECRMLLDAVDRVVSGGGAETILVSGYSGIGKSALVNELHRALVQPRGLFIAGKFDQFRRDVPYATIVEAFQSLVRQILMQSDAAIYHWRRALHDALGNYGQLLIDLIPELELVIGKQPAVLALPPTEARTRFHTVFHAFVSAIAKPEHPLVLFLDDLQWLDHGSLVLLEHLLSRPDLGHVLVIGAYRDNEVGPAHPLSITLAAIRKTEAVIHEIFLGPLLLGDLVQLVAATLRCAPERAAPLAELVREKTGGNPFFTLQWVSTLQDEGLLTFDRTEADWRWELPQIRARGLTDDVVELMGEKLRRLPETTRAALACLACLGNGAHLGTLAAVRGRPVEAVVADLDDALRAGFVYRTDERVTFAHDRIQEAAYALTPADRLADLHLTIGRKLLSARHGDDDIQTVFALVGQFNQAIDLVTDPEEKALLCRLNAQAGRKAMASSAFASARSYLAQAFALLPDESWSARHEEAFDLLLDLAECEFLAGDLETADKLFAQALTRATSKRESGRAYRQRIDCYQLAGRWADAAAQGLEALKLFGVVYPESNEAILAAVATLRQETADLLGGRAIADLLDAPPMTDSDLKVVIDIAAFLAPILYGVRPELYVINLQTALNLCLRHGNIPVSALIYGCYGVVVSGLFNEFANASAYCEMALRLAEKFRDSKWTGRLLYLQAAFVTPWQQPLRTSVTLLEQAYIACVDVGAIAVAGYAAGVHAANLFEQGEKLDVLSQSLRRHIAFTDETRNQVLGQLIRSIDLVVGRLRDEGDAAVQDAEAAVGAGVAQSGVGSCLAYHHIYRQLEAFIFGRHEDARAAGAAAAPFVDTVQGQAVTATYWTVDALTVAALWSPAADGAPEEIGATLSGHRGKLAQWAAQCPENFSYRQTLVEAEIARVEGRSVEALRLYDQAIGLAADHGATQWEALAWECAGRFYLACGLSRNADNYLRSARDAYERWGALAKVRQIERDHPRVATSASVAVVDGLNASQLDTQEILKAYRLIAGEIVLPDLLRTLLRLVIETAGAERASLLLMSGEALQVVAEIELGETSNEVIVETRPVDADLLPLSVVNYVRRSLKSVLLADAGEPGLFRNDSYIVSRRPKSLLCIPLLKHGGFVGLLYLENRLVARAFLPARVSTLELLARQVAVSIDNARLYAELRTHHDQLESLVEERTAEVLRQKKRLDQTLAELELILEHASLGIALVTASPAGRFVARVNRALEDMFGYDHGELNGRNMRLLFRSDDESEEFSRIYDDVLRQASPYNGELIFRRKDGSSLCGALVGTAVDPRDRDKGAIWLLEDITELRQTEAELREAKAVAEAANAAKSSFLANMSHEIRTPMNAVIGLSHLALNTELTRRQRDYLEKINGSAKALLGILNDILDMSKIEAGKLDIELAEFDLDDVLRHVAITLGTRVEEKGLELVFAVEPDVPNRLVGDSLRLGQILLNLCSNAVKFTEEGEITVAGELLGEAEGKLSLRFAVTDSGIGMTEDQVARLFAPFNQADASTTRRFGGTGLGLSIAKRLVEMMDGEIGVDSVFGKGTTFWFRIVLGRGVEHKAIRVIDRAFFASLNVLVVDDNASARGILVRFLAASGCKVDQAASGAEAVEACVRAADPYHLVMMDMRMPGMNGLQAAERIRQANAGAPPKIILVSAYWRDELGSLQDRDSPLSGFLAKPIDQSALIDTLLTVFGQTDTAAAARRADVVDTAPNFRGVRVLLVEDNEINQMVASELLEAAGFIVTIAGDGRQGVDRALGEAYDVVLMDVHMPVLDGYAASRELRTYPRLADLPIIAMTANAMTEDHQRALDAGMNDHIAKPIDVDKMFAVIGKWLAKAPARQLNGANLMGLRQG
jgi:PAS domain S-box-containing protein